jgi:hypothetical protein
VGSQVADLAPHFGRVTITTHASEGFNSMSTAGEFRRDSYDWLHFAARSGEQGRAWAEQYRRHTSIADVSDRALDLLRRDQFAAGLAALRECAASLEALGPCPTSMRLMFERWYHGAAGYYFYRIEDFDRAQRSMCLAHEAVVGAVSEAGFLVLVSVHCKEFCLHQARIARNRRRWREMTEHIERGWAMTRGDQPLCTTRNGRAISFATIAAFLGSLEPLTDGEREVARSLVDDRTRAILFDRFVRALDCPSDLAIRYP